MRNFKRSQFAILVVSSLILSACFHRPTQEDTPHFSGIPTLTGIYKNANNSSIRVTGSCQGNSQIRMTYSSPLTPESMVKYNCVKDTISLDLPVMEGTRVQVFSFEFRALRKEKLTPALKITFNYVPQPDPVAGFGITSGGGIPATGTFASIQNSSIGEITDPPTLSGTDMSARTGVQGVIDP